MNEYMLFPGCSLPYTFYFGVKFYAADPCKLREEITRYLIVLPITTPGVARETHQHFSLPAVAVNRHHTNSSY